MVKETSDDTTQSQQSHEQQEQSWIKENPLLGCLVIMTRIFHQAYEPETLIAGLPLEEQAFTSALFIRAAERAGLVVTAKKRSLETIPDVLLPAVLLLKNEQAIILKKKLTNDQYLFIHPENPDAEVQASLAQINANYTGEVLFIQKEHQFENRTEHEQYTPAGKHWFWSTLWDFKRYYAQVIFASFFINLFSLAAPLFVMNVYDRVVPNKATETLWVLAVGALTVFIFDFLLRTLRAVIIDLAGKKIDILLSSQLFSRALSIKVLHQAPSAGVQASHLKDFEMLRDFFTSATITSLIDLPFVFLFVFFIFFLGGNLGFVPLLMIPIVFAVAGLLSIPLRKATDKSFVGSAQKSALLFEALNNVETVKSSLAESSLLNRWEKYASITAKYNNAARFYSTLAMNFCMISNYIVTIVIVILGIYELNEQKISLGAIIACTILAGRAMAPLAQVTNLLTRYYTTRLALRSLNTLMDKPIDRPKQHKFLHRASLNGDINAASVSFSYPNSPVSLLKEINLDIKAGEKIALIGSMGSGKTTLLKLLMGFYSPISGAIYLDGIDISQIDPNDLRRMIGFVEQNPKLFYGTARDNLAIKAPWINDKKILKWAKIAGADNFIRKHPVGYDMPIAENAKDLSGGQIQTIAIARALMTDPNILLLDEPSSQMDNTTEQNLIQNLRSIYREKTMILVTHKVSMLSLVDRIILLQSGKIIADGEKAKVLAFLSEIHQKNDSKDDSNVG